MARFFDLGREVLNLRVGEFFAWADAMPELMRREELATVRSLMLAGQRGVSDESYKEIMRNLEQPVRRGERVSEAERLALETKVAELNGIAGEL